MAQQRPVPDYYKNHISPPYAKIYFPTSEEFSDPFTYVDSIRHDGRYYGVIKIVPPKDFKPPFSLARSLEFRPRAQRICLTDVFTKEHYQIMEKLRIYYENEPIKRKIPKFDGKELNFTLFCLALSKHNIDEDICSKSKWIKIANECCIDEKHAISLKYYYCHVFGEFFTCLKCEQKLRLLAGKGYNLRNNIENLDDENDENCNAPSPPEINQQIIDIEDQIKKETSNFLSTEDIKQEVLPSDVDMNDDSLEAPQLEPMIKKCKLSKETSLNDDDSLEAPTDLECHAEHKRDLSIEGIISISDNEFKGRPPRQAKTNFFTKLHNKFNCNFEVYDVINSTSITPIKTENINEEQIPELPDLVRNKHVLPTLELQKQYKMSFLKVKINQNIPKEFIIPATTARNFFDAPESFTLQSFKEHADRFKALYFKKKRSTDVKISEVEQEFWKHVGCMYSDLYAFYGADLNSGNFGSGFPILKKSTDEQYKENSNFYEYAKHPWNLNNMPIASKSAFCHLEANISGMTIPWVYVGMCFSLFCWHVEDHWTYSINYMHEGETKVWYGIPERHASKFDTFMQSLAPESFVENKDLLHHMNTMIHPQILRDNGIDVYTVHQNVGEIVITFPRAYHAGFNAGYNVAEAVNFAPYDWLQAGRRCLANYAKVGRGCVFSHDSLIFNMAKQRHKLDQKMFNAVLMEYRAVIKREKYYRACLAKKGFEFRMCPVNLADVITNEDFRSCVKCNTLLYSSAVLCKHMKSACPMHFDRLCNICLPSQYRFGYSDDILSLEKAFNKFFLPFDFRIYEEFCLNLSNLIKSDKLKSDDNILDILLIAVVKNWKSDDITSLYEVLNDELHNKFQLLAETKKNKISNGKIFDEKNIEEIINNEIDYQLLELERTEIINKIKNKNQKLKELITFTALNFKERHKYLNNVKLLRDEINQMIRKYSRKRSQFKNKSSNLLKEDFKIKKPLTIKENQIMKITIPNTSLVGNNEDLTKIRGEIELPLYRIPEIFHKRCIITKKNAHKDLNIINPLNIYRLFNLLNNKNKKICIKARKKLRQILNKCIHKKRNVCGKCKFVRKICEVISENDKIRKEIEDKVINNIVNHNNDDGTMIKRKEIKLIEQLNFIEQYEELNKEYNNLKNRLEDLTNKIIEDEVQPFLLTLDLLIAADEISSYLTVNKLRDKVKLLNLRVPITHYTNYTYNDLSELHSLAVKYQQHGDVNKAMHYIESLFLRAVLFEEEAENILINPKNEKKGLLALNNFANIHLHPNTWFGEKSYMLCFKKMEEEEKIAKEMENFLKHELHTINSMKNINNRLNKSIILNNSDEYNAINSVMPYAIKIYHELYQLFNISNSYYRVLDILYGRHDLKLLFDGGHYPVYKSSCKDAEYIIDSYLTNRYNSLKYTLDGQKYHKIFIPEMVKLNYNEIHNTKDPKVICNCGNFCSEDSNRPFNWIKCIICGVKNHIQCAVWNNHFDNIKEGTYYCQRCLRSRKPLLKDVCELVNEDMFDLNEYFVLKIFIQEQKALFDRFHTLNINELSKDKFLCESALILSADVTDGKTENELLSNSYYSDYYNETQLIKWSIVKELQMLYEKASFNRLVIFEYRQPRKKAFSDKTVLKELPFFECYGVACKSEEICTKPKGRPIAFRCVENKCSYFCHFDCITITRDFIQQLNNYKCKICKCRKC